MIQERAFYYVFNFLNPSATLGLTTLAQVLRLDPDAPFRSFGIAVVVYNGTSGQASLAVRFSRGDQDYIQKILTPAPMLDPFDTGNTVGAAGAQGPSFVYYAPLYPNILYQPDSAIDIDIQNLPLNSSTVALVVFVGTKIFKPGSVWRPPLPENYNTLPLLSYPLQLQFTSLPARDVVFQASNEAGILWQAGQHTTVGIPASSHIGLKFRDYMGKPYMNDFVPVELLFGFDNAQIPGFPYPEIYIPRNELLVFDAAVIA
jgi:hypothetical protein